MLLGITRLLLPLQQKGMCTGVAVMVVSAQKLALVNGRWQWEG